MSRAIRFAIVILVVFLTGVCGVEAKPPSDIHGDALPRYALARLGTVRWRSASPPLGYGYGFGGIYRPGYSDVRLSPDGRFLAAREDQTITIWNATTGQLITRWPDLGYVRGLAFSPDSKTLLLETPAERMPIDDQKKSALQFRRYNLRTGRLVSEVQLDQIHYWTRWAKFTADGKSVVIDNGENSLLVCDLQTGKPVRIVDSTHVFWHPAEVSADGGKIAAINKEADGVAVFDSETGKEVFSWETERPSDPSLWIRHLALSADGHALAVTSGSRVICWDLKSGERKSVALDQAGAVAFSPDGRYLACADHKTIHLLEAKSLREVRTFTEHHDMILALAFSPRKRCLSQ
jgi:WD40 repeat protein